MDLKERFKTMNLYNMNQEEITCTEEFIKNKETYLNLKNVGKGRPELENLFRFAQLVLEEGQAGLNYFKKGRELEGLNARVNDKEMTAKGFEIKVKSIENRKASFSKIKVLFDQFKNFVFPIKCNYSWLNRRLSAKN